MIYGPRNSPARDASKKSLYFVQTRSPIEAILKAHDSQNFNTTDAKYWLETCGPHSMANAVLAVAPDPSIYDVKTPGGWVPRMPDLATLFFNGPQQIPAFQKLLPDTDFDTALENEYLALYPTACAALFGVRCQYKASHTWQDLIDAMKAGQSVQIVLTKPGHFLAVVGYDDQTNELVYIDPDDRRQPADGWWRARIGQAEHDSNVKPWVCIYG